MTLVGYIISVDASENNSDVIQTVQKIAGQGQMIFATTTEALSTYLFCIPAGMKSPKELTIQLQAVPDLSKLSVVALSKPLKAQNYQTCGIYSLALVWMRAT